MKERFSGKAKKSSKARAKLAIGGRHIRNASPARATVRRSVGLADELREQLGEVQLVTILRSIRDVIRQATTAIDETGARRLQNTVRVEALRSVILKDAVSSDVAGGFISRTRPVVNKLAKRGELLALKDGRILRFPRWQFDDRSEDGLVPGLRRVLALMDASPLRKAAWLISPNPHLSGNAPLDSLRKGHLERVFEAATAVTSG